MGTQLHYSRHAHKTEGNGTGMEETTRIQIMCHCSPDTTSTMLCFCSAQEKCHQYWPAERSARYQYFVVDPMAEYNMPQYILREFKVTDARVSSWCLCVKTLLFLL